MIHDHDDSDPARAASFQRFRVDVSRGERVGRVSSERFSRLDDERYLSLTDLYDAVGRRADGAQARGKPTRAVQPQMAPSLPVAVSIMSSPDFWSGGWSRGPFAGSGDLLGSGSLALRYFDVRSTAAADANATGLADLLASEIRQAIDGWHAVLRIHGGEHRLLASESRWSPVRPMPPSCRSTMISRFALTPPAASDGRSTIAHPVPHFRKLSLQRRQRLVLALRALDARVEGNSYRTIAEGLYGGKRIPERAWKTHDLRAEPFAWCKAVLRWMRGGYRALLRQARRKQ
jgi:hypothetical protein